MKALMFLVGLIFGIVGGAAVVVYLQAQNQGDMGEMSIIFPNKFYYDNDAMVTMSGTLTGKGLGYPNNTYSLVCYPESKQCWVSSVQAIGASQIGRMDAPAAYGIKRWTPSEVVAIDEGSFACFKTTITIQRKSQQLLWVEEPINQAQPQCKNADTSVRKYTLEDSPGWKRFNSK